MKRQMKVYFTDRVPPTKPEQCLILHPKILNLSGIPLSKKQIELLSKDLKFTSILKPNIPEIKKDRRFQKKTKGKRVFWRWKW